MCSELQECPQGCQPGVAAPHRIMTHLFQVIGHRRSGEVGVDWESDGLGDGEVASTTSETNDTGFLDQALVTCAGTRRPANRSVSGSSVSTRLRASW